MARNLPPFAAVRAFEAAARHCNLKGAAAELNVLPSAVSHQLQALESYISVKLFLRSPNGLQLTAEGQDYLESLSSALDLMELATIRAGAPRKGKRIKINTYISLAQEWLIPRLAEFRAAHPEITVSLVTLPEELALSGSDIDLAIRCAAQPPGGCQCDLLFPDEMVPVCAPGYSGLKGRIESPQDLAVCDLILYEGAPDEWPRWCRAFDVDETALSYCITLDTRMAALQAARAGLGLAMSRRPYSDIMIERGDLIAPFASSVDSSMSYYLLTPERAQANESVKCIGAWLLSLSQRALRPLAQRDEARTPLQPARA